MLCSSGTGHSFCPVFLRFLFLILFCIQIFSTKEKYVDILYKIRVVVALFNKNVKNALFQ